MPETLRTNLSLIETALDDLTGDELRALAEAAHKVPQYKAPSLLAWIDAACEWELNRRADIHYPLQSPHAAIPSDEDGISISIAGALRATFAADHHASALTTFLDALLELMVGGPERSASSESLRAS